MITKQKVYLSHTNWTIPPVVHAVQGDTGRELEMVLVDLEIDADMTATLAVKRSSGTHNDIGTTADLAENSFTADITQALTRSGDTECQLKVKNDDDEVVSTYTFIIAVQGDTSGDSEDEGGGGSSTDYSDLTNKPSINSVTLSGNKTGGALGLIDAPASPTDGDFLVYDAITGKWIAQTVPNAQGVSF